MFYGKQISVIKYESHNYVSIGPNTYDLRDLNVANDRAVRVATYWSDKIRMVETIV